jgi:hypothetical protein
MLHDAKNSTDSNDMTTKLPEKKRQPKIIFYALIFACWLFLLYFYGGIKGPG